ncbi:hypothetical protein ADUPG1_007213, partial [Aduncisulcus paluster]
PHLFPFLFELHGFGNLLTLIEGCKEEDFRLAMCNHLHISSESIGLGNDDVGPDGTLWKNAGMSKSPSFLSSSALSSSTLVSSSASPPPPSMVSGGLLGSSGIQISQIPSSSASSSASSSSSSGVPANPSLSSHRSHMPPFFSAASSRSLISSLPLSFPSSSAADTLSHAIAIIMVSVHGVLMAATRKGQNWKNDLQKSMKSGAITSRFVYSSQCGL